MASQIPWAKWTAPAFYENFCRLVPALHYYKQYFEYLWLPSQKHTPVGIESAPAAIVNLERQFIFLFPFLHDAISEESSRACLFAGGEVCKAWREWKRHSAGRGPFRASRQERRKVRSGCRRDIVAEQADEDPPLAVAHHVD